MATQRNAIEYPKNPSELQLIQCGGACHFAAFGFAPQGTKSVRLRLIRNGTTFMEAPLELKQPGLDGFWSLAFVGVHPEAQTFTVDMELSDKETTKPLATVQNITVPPQKSKDQTRIIFPLPTSPRVPSSFTAQGSTDKSNNVFAQLTGPATVPSSPALATISGGAWFVAFQGVRPASDNYTLIAFEGTTVADRKLPIKIGE
jgi:hypothetical protein